MATGVDEEIGEVITVPPESRRLEVVPAQLVIHARFESRVIEVKDDVIG